MKMRCERLYHLVGMLIRWPVSPAPSPKRITAAFPLVSELGRWRHWMTACDVSLSSSPNTTASVRANTGWTRRRRRKDRAAGQPEALAGPIGTACHYARDKATSKANRTWRVVLLVVTAPLWLAFAVV